ncbi:MAG: heparinase II/III family protein, partial [Armatimonadota bacterium]
AYINRADEVVDRDAEWIRQHCPEKGSIFAVGQTGCPRCGASWGRWRGANCSFDRPGTVECRNGHILPDEDHPDDGSGWEGEDGRTYYFVASYNSWVVETYQQWCRYLSMAYIMTGDEKYAKTCSVILDALAEIYPTCTGGSVEYPSGHGRLSRPGYQVARVLVLLVDYYDRIYNSPALQEPSFVEGMTRRENIETNLMQNAAWYCYEKSFRGGLDNGIADYIRGSLAVGCLLGIPAYIDWAVDGPFGIRALAGNNVGRDGRYHETALCYSRHARSLYLTYADPLLNYRSEEYPQGLNLYDDEHFRSFYVLPMLSMNCAGHWPRYGDCAPDTSKITPPERYSDKTDIQFAERVYAGTSDPQVNKDFGILLNWLTNGDIDRHRASGNAAWLLFHAETVPTTDDAIPEYLLRRITDTTVMGQKGMAFLRTPGGPRAQAALLRYGPVCNHSHFDDLNLNYYALGYEVTYDIGYGWGNTHTQVGWAKQTASHNLVLVNEAKQRINPEDGTGGSLYLAAGMPGMQVVDAEAKAAYRSQNLQMYRRMLALVGDGPESYLLDIFNVRGGHQHDYMLHALSDDLSVSGVELSEPAEGSVAGPEYNWGERQMNDGFLKGVPHKNYMVVEPKNGLGFLMHPRRGAANDAVQATWQLPDVGDHFRATLLPGDDTEIVTAWAPGIYPDRPKAAYLMARRASQTDDLSSTFVTVMEPYGPQPGGDTISASEMIRTARTDGGSIKHVDSHDLMLFQADEPGDVVEMPFDIETAGEYYLVVRPYTSPGYGTCRFFVNGEVRGEPFTGSDEGVHPGETQVLGPLQLAAGTHTLGVEMLEGPGTNLWMGIGSVTVTQEKPATDHASSPFIKSVRLMQAPSDVTAVEVEHTSGTVERFIYNLGGGSAQAGPISLDGYFGSMRTGTNGLTSARLIGKSLTGDGLQMQLNRDGYSGQIARIDYDAHLVYVDAELPTDDRLRFETVTFDSPSYSRNTAYTIYGVHREGDLSVIDLGPQRIGLGEGTVHEVLGAKKLTSLTPHGYAKGREFRFFQGKTLITDDGAAKTHVTSTEWGEQFVLNVESTDGFAPGEKFNYLDLQPGDTFTIHNWASVSNRLTAK